jgi:catechol 2,3-dioxygenase-like lactoylglutathione lyase family enzyme
VIDHVSIAVSDLKIAGLFYDAVLASLGLSRLTTGEERIGYGKRYPEFWLNLRPDVIPIKKPGAHICLRAPDRSAVALFYSRALELGATDDGAPSERVATVTTYFAAFIIDADGNKIEAATFPKNWPAPEPDAPDRAQSNRATARIRQRYIATERLQRWLIQRLWSN